MDIIDIVPFVGMCFYSIYTGYIDTVSLHGYRGKNAKDYTGQKKEGHDIDTDPVRYCTNMIKSLIKH